MAWKPWPLGHNIVAKEGQYCLVIFVSCPLSRGLARDTGQWEPRGTSEGAGPWGRDTCKDTASTLHRFGWQASMRVPNFLVQGAQTLFLKTGSFSFSFYLRLEGKDALAQPAAEAPAQWVSGGSRLLKVGPASPRLVYHLWLSGHRGGSALLKPTIWKCCCCCN